MASRISLQGLSPALDRAEGPTKRLAGHVDDHLDEDIEHLRDLSRNLSVWVIRRPRSHQLEGRNRTVLAQRPFIW